MDIDNAVLIGGLGIVLTLLLVVTVVFGFGADHKIGNTDITYDIEKNNNTYVFTTSQEVDEIRVELPFLDQPLRSPDTDRIEMTLSNEPEAEIFVTVNGEEYQLGPVKDMNY